MCEPGIVSRGVVVSGGGTGMGLAIARAFAAADDRVVIVGRRTGVLRAAIGREVGERVDVLVNNAGGLRQVAGDGLAATAEAWRVTFDANVTTAVLLTEALRPWLAAPGGRVVTISSIAGLRGGGAYGAA